MDSIMKKSGRLIFGIPFLIFGIMHFVFGSGMNGLVPGFLPFPLFWVYFTGLALVAASISFIIDKYVYHAGLGLAIFLILTALLVHLPMVLSGNMQPNFSAMLKDIMLAGAAIWFSADRAPR